MGVDAKAEAAARAWAAAEAWMAELVDAPAVQMATEGARSVNRMEGWTPLHTAVAGGSLECLALLLAEGGALFGVFKSGRAFLRSRAH